jgi:DNA-binding transcriptional LysR family regulator
VILASGQGAFLYLLGAAIRRFPKEKWPLRLVSMSGPEAIEAVREANAHLCVVGTDAPPTDLDVTRLRSVGQQVVLPSSHRLARRRSLKPADLEGEQLVVAPAGSPHRVMLQQLMRASGHDLAVAVEATGWELMLQFARYGVGIAVVNDFCPVPKGMIGIPLQGAPEITYYLMARSALPSEGSKVMRELIEETARTSHAERSDRK